MHDIYDFLTGVRDVREYKRAMVVRLSLEGYLDEDICTLLSISSSFIQKWVSLYRLHDVRVFRLGYTGYSGYLTNEERDSVLTWLRERDSWNVAALRAYLETTYAVTYQSDQSYYAFFHDAGISYKKSQLTNPKQDPVAIEQKKRDNHISSHPSRRYCKPNNDCSFYGRKSS